MTANAATADHDHGHDHGHGAHEEHIHPPSFYIKTWGVLMVLLIVSIVGPMAEIRVLTLITAFGVALVKAWIVCSRFMHLDVEKRWVVYFLTTAIAFMALFFFAIAPDILKHDGTNWTNVAAKAELTKHQAELDAMHANHGHAADGEHGDHGGRQPSEALVKHREEAQSSLKGIDAAMKSIAADLKAQAPAPAPAEAAPAEAAPAEGAAAPAEGAAAPAEAAHGDH